MPNTREKLIEVLETVVSPKEVLCDGEVLVSTSRVADYLIANGVTFAEDNNVPSNWIPVTERLPESGKIVLVNQVNSGVSEGSYSTYEKKWRHFRWGAKYIEVTHWMPLPEPPKGE